MPLSRCFTRLLLDSIASPIRTCRIQRLIFPSVARRRSREVTVQKIKMSTVVNKTLSLLDICESTNDNNLWFVVLLLGLCGISTSILLAFMVHACILRTTTCCCTWRSCCCCSSAPDDVEKSRSQSRSSCFGRGRESKPKSVANVADFVTTDYARDDRLGDEALQAIRHSL